MEGCPLALALAVLATESLGYLVYHKVGQYLINGIPLLKYDSS